MTIATYNGARALLERDFAHDPTTLARALITLDQKRTASYIDTGLSAPVDFAFVQHMSPELAPAAWRPAFLDYMHLGFTNATAFSPTDVMPLTHRAKYTMLVQATISLALLGLIVARAVGTFS